PPWNLPPGPRKAPPHPYLPRSRAARHDNRDRRRGVLRGQGGWRRDRHDNVHFEADQLGGKVREPLELAIRRSALYQHVLAFEVSKLPHRIPECLLDAAAGGEIAYSVYVPWLLCLDSERRGEEASRDSRHESPALHYSIT